MIKTPDSQEEERAIVDTENSLSWHTIAYVGCQRLMALPVHESSRHAATILPMRLNYVTRIDADGQCRNQTNKGRVAARD